MKKSEPFQEEWIENVISGCNSKATKVAYGVYLKQYHDYLKLNCLELSRKSVNDFKFSMIEKGLSGSAINLFLAAIRRLASEEIWDINPHLVQSIRLVKSVRYEREKKRRFINAAERHRMLMYCFDGTVTGIRNAAAMAVLFGAGLRASEVLNLDLEHINDDHLVVKHGKGRKNRIVYINKQLKNYLNTWLAVRKAEKNEKAFFVGTRLGRRWRYNEFYIMFKRVGEAVGLGEVYPHLARGSYISEMLNITDIAVVAKSAGHESIDMTASYDLRDDKKSKLAAETFILE